MNMMKFKAPTGDVITVKVQQSRNEKMRIDKPRPRVVTQMARHGYLPCGIRQR
jgi:hypothetical protein